MPRVFLFLATRGIAHSTWIYHIRNSSPPTFHPDVSQPQLYPADVPPHPNISYLDPADVPPHPDISHSDSADVSPFSDISHPTHAARWERRTIQLPWIDMSGYSGDAYPDSLARQTLVIRRIHFRPQ